MNLNLINLNLFKLKPAIVVEKLTIGILLAVAISFSQLEYT